jgi:hypothetical protein
MTIYVDITPQEAAWLDSQARQQGLPPAEIIKRMIGAEVAAAGAGIAPTQAPPRLDAEQAAAIALLKSYLETEAAADPEEIRVAEEELAELKRSMNANREATAERLVFP